LCAAATQPVFLPEAYADTHKKVLVHFQPRLPATLLKRFNSLRSTYYKLAFFSTGEMGLSENEAGHPNSGWDYHHVSKNSQNPMANIG
jgi:hypothetical protein